ncbi:hypothetical protein IRJ41_017052 [Triplophysa rosa]|uniref:Uncharacterized protein n=1 Tax=Triplophysa rosa TaxID=992332 RepID=A0A9W7W9C0_TRIRA|nr:hypothetical protein IRJ41_017052 [Triplophysa rosa]
MHGHEVSSVFVKANFAYDNAISKKYEQTVQRVRPQNVDNVEHSRLLKEVRRDTQKSTGGSDEQWDATATMTRMLASVMNGRGCSKT